MVESAARPERHNLLVPGLEPWPSDPSRPVFLLEDVWKSFDGHAVLKGLTLAVRTGHTTVIAGQSGSGKSILLKLMMGLVRPDRGRVVAFGQDLARMSEVALTELRKRMAMVFQNYALLDSLTVAENVAFVLRENSRLPAREIDARVAALLQRFELTDASRKTPAEISGGMKKRVSLARALVFDPEVLLVDEPTTGLDPVMTERVTELLLAIRREFGITSVVVSHDMASATRIADTIAVLGDGRIVVEGTPAEVRASSSALVQSFFEGSGAEVVASVSSERAIPAADRPHPVVPVVELRGVHKMFGGHAVLKGVDLVVPPKKITVIIGGSGSGKSVIIKHIMGLLKPDSGEVRLFDKDIVPMGERELQEVRARFGMLFQGAALLDSLSVEENVAFPLVERLRLPTKEVRQRVGDILEKVHIPDIAKRFPSEISNGQRKRVGLARAMVTRPEVIIYDEPTTGQDPVMTRLVDDMIVEARETFDVTSIVISHDMSSAFRIAHEIAMLHKGVMIVQGPPAVVAASTDERVRRFVYASHLGLTDDVPSPDW